MMASTEPKILLVNDDYLVKACNPLYGVIEKIKTFFKSQMSI